MILPPLLTVLGIFVFTMFEAVVLLTCSAFNSTYSESKVSNKEAETREKIVLGELVLFSCVEERIVIVNAIAMRINTFCPTRYRTRNFFNNSKLEEEYVRCVRNEEECVCSAPNCCDTEQRSTSQPASLLLEKCRFR